MALGHGQQRRLAPGAGPLGQPEAHAVPGAVAIAAPAVHALHTLHVVGAQRALRPQAAHQARRLEVGQPPGPGHDAPDLLFKEDPALRIVHGAEPLRPLRRGRGLRLPRRGRGPGRGLRRAALGVQPGVQQVRLPHLGGGRVLRTGLHVLRRRGLPQRGGERRQHEQRGEDCDSTEHGQASLVGLSKYGITHRPRCPVPGKS